MARCTRRIWARRPTRSRGGWMSTTRTRHGRSRRKGAPGRRGVSWPRSPMEARVIAEPPVGPEWQYEPKWDGFRCIARRDGERVELRSKSGRPLARYFPDLVESLRAMRAERFMLDGEIVIPI